MLDLTRCEDSQLDLVRRVAAEIVSLTPGLDARNIMIVGAACRDVLHSALGHDFGLRATHDVDVALALSEWTDFEELTSRLTAIKGAVSNGIRYRVDGLPVDLLPFGSVEDPTGTVTPQPRNQGMSVWAFAEVFDHSLELPLDEHLTVRMPSIPGYAALKLCAWLDRAAYYQYKDAPDIAVAINWYARSPVIEQNLYETDSGNDILIACEMDVTVASAYLLGRDIGAVIGLERQAELASRWPGEHESALLREMSLSSGAGWRNDLDWRREIVRGLERGLFD